MDSLNPQQEEAALPEAIASSPEMLIPGSTALTGGPQRNGFTIPKWRNKTTQLQIINIFHVTS